MVVPLWESALRESPALATTYFYFVISTTLAVQPVPLPTLPPSPITPAFYRIAFSFVLPYSLSINQSTFLKVRSRAFLQSFFLYYQVSFKSGTNISATYLLTQGPEQANEYLHDHRRLQTGHCRRRCRVHGLQHLTCSCATLYGIVWRVPCIQPDTKRILPFEPWWIFLVVSGSDRQTPIQICKSQQQQWVGWILIKQRILNTIHLMSSVEVSKLSPQEIAHLACTYAALILHDDGQDITADKISTLVKAAGVKCESYWPKMFAKAIQGQSLSTFFNFGGSAASAPAAGGAPAPAAKEAAKQTKKEQTKKDDKKAKKEEAPKEEEEEVGMGDLFG